MPGVTLRALDPTRDYERVAAIRNAEDANQISVETLLEWDRNWPVEGVRRRMVAETADGEIAGYSISFRRPSEPVGRFELRLIVDRAFRNRGVGAALYGDAHAFLQSEGAMRVDALTKDNSAEGLTFAEKRGFHKHRHLFESVLDISAFDDSRFRGVVDRAAESGIRFFSFGDTDGSEAEQRRLWELNVTTAQDVPGTDFVIRETWPFEQFQKDVFQSTWYRPEGQILAESDGRLVGLCAVGEFETGRFSNTHTGVLAEYRGRGIALALKLLAVESVRRLGGKSLRTNNDSDNAPMIHINLTLGYRPEPGWFVMKQERITT